jgi:hypothetical protein
MGALGEIHIALYRSRDCKQKDRPIGTATPPSVWVLQHTNMKSGKFAELMLSMVLDQNYGSSLCSFFLLLL